MAATPGTISRGRTGPKKRAFYCACNPRMKKDRVPTRLYCLRHRKFVCEDCLESEERSHTTCLVTDYFEWVKAHGNVGRNSEFVVCSLCRKGINDSSRDQIRLTCGAYCVFHYGCIEKYLLKTLPSFANKVLTAKDPGIMCPHCKTELYLPLRPTTNLQKALEKLFKLLPGGRSLIRHHKRPVQIPQTDPGNLAGDKKVSGATSQKKIPRTPKSMQQKQTLSAASSPQEKFGLSARGKAEQTNLLASPSEMDPLIDLELGGTEMHKGYESRKKFAKRLYFQLVYRVIRMPAFIALIIIVTVVILVLFMRS